MVRYGVMTAVVARMLLSDRRLHVTVITGVIGAAALASMVKTGEARPVRRAAAWYWRLGDSQEPAR
jgi:hypothetical protein